MDSLTGSNWVENACHFKYMDGDYLQATSFLETGPASGAWVVKARVLRISIRAGWQTVCLARVNPEA
jgi:hypothetical protein